jgi:hypothetical protein
LQRLIVGAAGLLALDPLTGEVRRKKKKKKKKRKPPACSSCPSCQQCQEGTCVAVANGIACGAGNICDGGACRALRCGDPGIDCLVFISSTRHTGNLGGLAGADTICQNLANAAGIPGQFMAWLSDSSASPSTRFPTKSSSPYKLLNGGKIADNWADLTDGTLDAFISVPDTGDEGGSGPGDYSWTATLGNGLATGEHCNNWTSASSGATGTAGYQRRALEAGGKWTVYTQATCQTNLHLYCVQQA